MRNKLKWTLALAIVVVSAQARAGEQVGTLTRFEGDVKIFTHPSASLPAGGSSAPRALYEKEYFVVESAREGMKLERGNIVRTAPGAKARIIFDNGDQYHVGPGTAFRVSWDKDSSQGKAVVDLAYGKVRGIVEKGGPRSRLQIRTKTATMGVRGTDFFVADGGAGGGTEVSIIRGSVEVKGKAPSSKPVQVQSGFSVAVPSASVVPAVELRKTTREELQGIQRSSTIAVAEPARSPEILQLEKKAVETTLKDIQAADPKLYAALSEGAPRSTDQINARAIEVLAKEAPRAPEKRKPFKSEIDDLEQGAYEKYFKPAE